MRAGILAAALLLPVAASAQESSWRSLPKAVFADPSLYAPAVASYATSRWDWDTSQVFFEHGWNEHNYRYTVNGRADGKPISYGAGERLIVNGTLRVLRDTAIHHASSQVVERLLSQRFASHRKLLKVAGVVERVTVSAVLTYFEAEQHVRQSFRNQRIARELGYTR